MIASDRLQVGLGEKILYSIRLSFDWPRWHEVKLMPSRPMIGYARVNNYSSNVSCNHSNGRNTVAWSESFHFMISN